MWIPEHFNIDCDQIQGKLVSCSLTACSKTNFLCKMSSACRNLSGNSLQPLIIAWQNRTAGQNLNWFEAITDTTRGSCKTTQSIVKLPFQTQGGDRCNEYIGARYVRCKFWWYQAASLEHFSYRKTWTWLLMYITDLFLVIQTHMYIHTERH